MRCDGLVAEVQDWAASLEEVHARIAGAFARAEPRARVLAYLRGLLGQLTTGPFQLDHEPLRFFARLVEGVGSLHPLPAQQGGPRDHEGRDGGGDEQERRYEDRPVDYVRIARHRRGGAKRDHAQEDGLAARRGDDAVRLDLYYVDNWSLAYDLSILWRTIWVVLKRKGAY